MHIETHQNYLESRTFDEINPGDSSTLVRTLHTEDIQLFAIMAGDINPSVTDRDISNSRESIAHGMWSASLISTVLGTQFPGPGTVLLDQSLRFLQPVRLNDTVSITVAVKEKLPLTRHIIFDCICTNQNGQAVVSGTARIQAPSEKMRTRRLAMPNITISDKYARLQTLVARAKDLPAIDMAVVHPCDLESLKGALMAAEAGLIDPILIGPEAKIRTIAEENTLDLKQHRIVNVKHSHESAAMAVTLIRNGDAEALMKGSLHTDEMMAEVVSRAAGLRTARRISHVFLMDVPSYSHPIMITDAAVNIAPTLEEKIDIIQNAIDLAHIIGVPDPKVAILSAIETINPKIQSTVDAAALCKMADRGQIRGGQLDGPLAFDNAVSTMAARTKGINSPVAGQADILVVPDLESGNMLAKQLEYMAHALAAAIVLGAKVPIVLTSRADTAETRIASCVIASLIAHSNRGKLQEAD